MTMIINQILLDTYWDYLSTGFILETVAGEARTII